MSPEKPDEMDAAAAAESRNGGSLLPEGFLFGVATAGFQVEGGFNGPGEPENNWVAWEREGRVESSGIALDFWNSYEAHLDRVAAMGCDSFRMSVEWARVCPAPGEVSQEALEGYRSILSACAERSIEPLVTLHHFTHPAWLGVDLWLRPDSPDLFCEWVRTAVGSLGGLCRNWVTINELNIYAVNTYLIGMFPPGRRGDVASATRAIDNMITAHVRAYEVIHEMEPDASVATNNFTLSIYELDRLASDVIAAPSLGVDRSRLGPWLASRRAEYYASLGSTGSVVGDRLEKAIRRLAARTSQLEEAFPRAVAAAYAASSPRLADVVQLDYYDPFAAHHVRLPGHRTAGGRTWLPGRMLWDDLPCPDDMRSFLEAARQPGLDIWIVENGLSNRVKRGRRYPRMDRYDRPRYMREHLAAVLGAIEAGLPITGYWHWTLADNYEWGSYEPRFGIFGVDRERGVRVGGLDSMGLDAAGAYRRLIEGLRSGDRSVLDPR